MNRQYSDKKIDKIAEKIVNRLQKQENGFESSVGEMADELGYSNMEILDMMELNQRVFAQAEEQGLVLDMSMHDGLEEGLPFNLVFVLKR